MSGFGGFTPEAYQQLQEAYNQQLTEAEEIENAGVKIGNETLGVETAPFKADWLDKTGLWKYPDGKGDYMDAKQKQENLLAALQTTEEDEKDDEIDFDNLSDEDIQEILDSISVEDEDGDGDGEEEEEEMTDGELEALVDELLSGSDSDDELEDSDSDLDDLDLDELESLVSEILGEPAQEAEINDDYDAISVSDKIAALKEELFMLSNSVQEDEEPEQPLEEEIPDDEPS